MIRCPQKVISFLVLIVLLWANYEFIDYYFIFKTQRPLLIEASIDGNYYSTNHYTQREDGTFEEVGTAINISPEFPEGELSESEIEALNALDESIAHKIYNPDIDEDGTLTAQELHTYQIVSRAAQLQSETATSFVDLLLFFPYLLIMIDAIGLSVVMSPWLKKRN